MTETATILTHVEDHVRAAFRKKASDQHLYHNLDHTIGVVEAVRLIGAGSGLPAEEQAIAEMAAWFHDLGFVDDGRGHEANSAQLAESFLQSHNYSESGIAQVRSLIMATKMPTNPQSLAEKVICDADMSHLGSKSFQEISHLLRIEMELVHGNIQTDAEWYRAQIGFMTRHQFYTDFAATSYRKRKKKNIVAVTDQLKAAEAEAATAKLKADQKEAKARLKEIKPDRGIETMFRLTSRNHMELSNMADNKANIMISINAIIISIIVSALVPKLDKNTFLIVPTFVLLMTSLLTIIFATMSTRPKVSGGTFTEEDLQQRRVNLLFFGNFYRMEFEDFHNAMQEMMEDRSFLYGTMVKDIYTLGKVLSRKYKLVRTAYNVFMMGLVLSVISFGMAFYVWSLNQPPVPGVVDL
ncbi:MAG: Pycsar system effector family protein [Bacteroidota bacterium]